MADTGRMAHFPKRFGFDLPDAFAGDAELPADLFKSSAIAVDEAESLFEHLPLAFG